MDLDQNSQQLFAADEIERFKNLQRSNVKQAFKGIISEELSGHSGVVYLIDRSINTIPRFIAAKTVKVKSDESLARFEEECKKWAIVNSPFVATAFYLEKRYGDTFLCLKYGDQSLISLLRASTLSPFGAVYIAIQMAYGLRDMQKLGIAFHQDYNPQNILIQDFSKTVSDFPPSEYDDSLKYRVMLSDFGMADYFVEDPINGARGGKFAYKAPEQYPDNGLHGFNPDIFSFGVIACLLFSKHHPSGMAKEKVLAKSNPKLNGGWEKWAKSDNRTIDLDPQYGLQISEILQSCLTVDPLRRPKIEEIIRILELEAGRLNERQFEIMTFHLGYLQSSFSATLAGSIRIYQ